MFPLSESNVSGFGGTARGLSKNPLGIIALFIVLVYGIACLLIAVGGMDPSERMPIIYFVVIFPIIVLFIFTWLVVNHSGKLFAPSDYRDESNYVKMQLSAAVSLAAATSKSDGLASAKNFDAIVETVQSSARRNASAQKRKSLLWVDDNPSNNTYERRAFEAIGVDVRIALTTEEGLSQLKSHQFDAIISDMGRREGQREGYVLLDALRKFDQQTPLFFYASSNSAAHKAETAEHGGQGCTNDPQELFEAVTRAIISSI